LVEVLIAVLVLGVGLLGMAALQATGMKVGQSSQMRTIATMAAYDLSERLRADPNNERIGALPVWSIGQSGCSATNATNVFERWRQDFFGLVCLRRRAVRRGRALIVLRLTAAPSRCAAMAIAKS